MSCYHPLKGFVLGEKSNGKMDLSIQSFDCDHIEMDSKGKWRAAYDSARSPYAYRVVSDWISIPCGQCLGCRLDYSRDWATRCMLELEDHDAAWFVTLTYNDNHLPLSFYSDPRSGLAFPAATLCKRDVQLFFKRLRKAYPNDNIRYYGCGEYGPENFRPHYHFIIYGLHLDDLEPYKRSREGFWYYRSERLERIWSFPCRDDNGQYIGSIPSAAGYVTVANVSFQTCAYVARYMTKKLKGKAAEFYDYFSIVPPCSFTSRRPGIGHSFFDKNADNLLVNSRISLSTSSGGRSVHIPRYYIDLYDELDPEAVKEYKYRNREAAKLFSEAKLSATNLSYLELLAIEERTKEKQTKLLCRADL